MGPELRIDARDFGDAGKASGATAPSCHQEADVVPEYSKLLTAFRDISAMTDDSPHAQNGSKTPLFRTIDL